VPEKRAKVALNQNLSEESKNKSSADGLFFRIDLSLHAKICRNQKDHQEHKGFIIIKSPL